MCLNKWLTWAYKGTCRWWGLGPLSGWRTQRDSSGWAKCAAWAAAGTSRNCCSRWSLSAGSAPPAHCPIVAAESLTPAFPTERSDSSVNISLGLGDSNPGKVHVQRCTSHVRLCWIIRKFMFPHIIKKLLFSKLFNYSYKFTLFKVLYHIAIGS